MTKNETQLFEPNQHKLAEADAVSPQCGSETQIRHSKSGPLIGCTSYPQCQYTKSMGDHQIQLVKLLDSPACPDCSNQLAVKNGRYGMFIGCVNYPDCKYIASMDEQEDTGVPCPSCNSGELFQRNNRYGKTFYACDGYPKCKYAVNFKPVVAKCPQCDWKILIEKNTAKGLTHQCPQKNCDYKSVPLD